MFVICLKITRLLFGEVIVTVSIHCSCTVKFDNNDWTEMLLSHYTDHEAVAGLPCCFMAITSRG